MTRVRRNVSPHSPVSSACLLGAANDYHMSSTAHSPSPDLFPTVWIRILIYDEDDEFPRVRAFNVPLHKYFRPSHTLWFEDAITGDHRRVILLWEGDGEDWSKVARDKVKLWIDGKSSSFIFRLRKVRRCLGLGSELQLQEQHREDLPNDVPTAPREVRDLRVPRHEKIGDDFTVVAYSAICAVAQVFIIRLERDGRIAVWDYPALAKVCFGCTSLKDATQGGMRVWNPQRVKFNYYKPVKPLYAVKGYDFIIVRNEYNKYAPGLGMYIEELERQTKHQVHPMNIPFDDPTRTPLARPALSVRVKRESSCEVSTDDESSDSDDESSSSDEDDANVMQADPHDSDEDSGEEMQQD
ncbi:hypothetical protein LXA43DRAFT_1100866 [Ganoderma leucocontextum]|nr:hypothetical protein LXA43DRAFT_1100866 [Ganoderma leucocontextum]